MSSDNLSEIQRVGHEDTNPLVSRKEMISMNKIYNQGKQETSMSHFLAPNDNTCVGEEENEEENESTEILE